MRRRTLLIAVLALCLLYPLAANLLLATPLFRALVNDPEMIEIRYSRAWSFWPGRIHAKDLVIRGHDGNGDWILTIDDADFDVALTELFQHRFHVTRVDGDGVSLRVRRRLKKPPRSVNEYVDLPRIDSLGPYAVEPPEGYDPQTWDDTKYRLWTVHVENVRAEHVREFWLDRERIEGDGRVSGSFYLRPMRALQIGPARAEIRHAYVARGPAVLAYGVAGAGDVTIERFDVRLIHGALFRRKIWIDADLRMKLPDAAAVPRSRAAELSIPVDASLVAFRMHRGELAPGTHVYLASPRWSARAAGATIGGTGALAADMPDETLRVRVDARVRARAEKDEATARVAAVATRAYPTFHDFASQLRLGIHVGDGTLRLGARQAAFALWLSAIGHGTGELDLEGTNGAARIGGWWMRLALSPAKLRLGRRPALDATVVVGADDAKPFLDALGITGISRRILTMPGLLAHARVVAGGGQVAVHELDARSRGARVRGDYVQSGGKKWGHLHVKKGPFGVAVRVDEHGTHITWL